MHFYFAAHILWSIFRLLYGVYFKKFCTPNKARSHYSKIADPRIIMTPITYNFLIPYQPIAVGV